MSQSLSCTPLCEMSVQALGQPTRHSCARAAHCDSPGEFGRLWKVSPKSAGPIRGAHSACACHAALSKVCRKVCHKACRKVCRTFMPLCCHPNPLGENPFSVLPNREISVHVARQQLLTAHQLSHRENLQTIPILPIMGSDKKAQTREHRNKNVLGLFWDFMRFC